MSLITKKQETFEIDYRQQPLPPVFVDTIDDIDPIDCNWLSPFDIEELNDFIELAQNTLLIAIDKLEDQRLINTLQNQADQGLRIFLCLGTERSNTSAIDQLRSRCLVRTGTRQQGALIIRDHNTLHKSGWLLTGTESDASYQIVLSKQQVDDSYRSFCKLFWEECDKEFSASDCHKAQSINSQIVVNHNYQIKNGLTPYFDTQSTGAFIWLVSSDDALAQQLSPHSDDRTKALLAETQSKLAEQIVAQQGQVSLTDQYLPNLVRVGHTYWLLPQDFNKAQSNWALQLNQQQSEDITQLLENNCEQAKWQLNKQAFVGELQGKTIKFTNNIGQAVTCEEWRERAVSPVYTSSFDEFFNADIKELTKNQTSWVKDQLASVIEYTAVRHPPYCPESAKVDSLHANWGSTQNQWEKAVEEQSAKLANLEKQQSGVADSIRKFIGQFVLGQNQQNKKLKKQLGALADWNSLLSSPAERAEKLLALQDIAKEIANNKQRTEQEICNAEAQQKWEQNKSQLSDAVAKAKKQVSDVKAQQDQKAPEFEKKLKHVEQEALREMEELSSKLKETEQEKLPKEFTLIAAEKFFGNNKNRKTFGVLHQAFERAKKQIKQINHQRSELDKRLLKVEKLLTSAHQQLSDHGERFIAPALQGDHLGQQLGIKDNKNLDITWPAEDLPQNELQLMRQGNQRYLVVLQENQLEQAKADAERLDAKLCAPTNKE